MTNLRKANDEQQSLQRWEAQQAAYEQPTLDPRSVLLVAQRLISEGDRAGAESIVKAYRASMKGN